MTVVLSPDRDRAAWLAARRAGIGASEIAAVLGLSPWESPFSLWWRKREGWDVEETDEMRTGTILESAIAQWGGEQVEADYDRSPWVDIRPSGLVAHPKRPWQLATPDRVVHERVQCGPCDYGLTMDCTCPGPALAALECKWAGSWDGWGEQGSDDVPVHYRCQVLWQCDVLGVHRWYIAVLGPSGFRLYVGRRDDRDIKVMVEAGRRFMARVEAGDPPALDEHTATVATLRRLHPKLSDETVEVPEAAAAGFLRAVRMRRLAEQVERRYEVQLRAAMGSARKGTTNGRPVAIHVIAEVAESMRKAHTRDYLLAPRSAKP